MDHLSVTKLAKEQYDYLIVVVSTDELVKAIRYVDKVVLQNYKNKYAAWEECHFDKMSVGSEWKGADIWSPFEEQFAPVDVEIVYLDHTDGISSTRRRDRLIKIYGIK